MSEPKFTPTIIKPRLLCIECGRCCLGTEMVLSKQDIVRISKLGFNPKEFISEKGSYYTLKNVGGHCFFYDPLENRCIIYPFRPIGCSIYPVVYNLEEDKVEVDSYCGCSRFIFC